MFKVIFLERVGLPGKRLLWFQRAIEIPFAPFPGLSIDGMAFEGADWNTAEQCFVVRYHMVLTEYASLEEAIIEQAKLGWQPCRKKGDGSDSEEIDKALFGIQTRPRGKKDPLQNWGPVG